MERRVPEDFPARLKSIRRNLGMTQGELAAPVYTKAYISMLESGRTRASMKALMHFSERLGVSIPELLGGRPKRGRASLAGISTEMLLQELGRRVRHG